MDSEYSKDAIQKPLYYLRQAVTQLQTFPHTGYALRCVRASGNGLLAIIDETEDEIDSACLKEDFSASFARFMDHLSLNGEASVSVEKKRKIHFTPRDAPARAAMLAYRTVLEREVHS